MKTTATVASWLVRLTGLFQIVTGLLFWTGNALALLPFHLLSGLVLVLSLWTLAFLALRGGVGPGLVILSVLWGLLVVVLGVTQTQVLPGELHWIIQLLHLLVGLVAIGLAGAMVRRIDPGRLETGTAVGVPG
jgi:hypothetical protein